MSFSNSAMLAPLLSFYYLSPCLTYFAADERRLPERDERPLDDEARLAVVLVLVARAPALPRVVVLRVPFRPLPLLGVCAPNTASCCDTWVGKGARLSSSS